GIAIAGAAHRKQARVVAISLLDQHVQGPFAARHDREARRPKPDDGSGSEILEEDLGPANRVAERQRRLLGHPRVIPAVRRDLVSRRGNAAHQPGMPLRDPAEHEERGARLRAGEQVEQPGDAPAHAGLEVAPIRIPHVSLERGDLEVLFHVDGEVVAGHAPPVMQRVCPAGLEHDRLGIVARSRHSSVAPAMRCSTAIPCASRSSPTSMPTSPRWRPCWPTSTTAVWTTSSTWATSSATTASPARPSPWCRPAASVASTETTI